MTPIRFPEANGTLGGGPAQKYGTEGDVLELPVHRGGGTVISCWGLTWRDRLRLLLTGKVWLSVLTVSTHHPVYVGVESPFTTPEEP